MLRLQCISSAPAIELPYHPDMPLWQYLRDIIAPAAGLHIDDGRTVHEQVLVQGVAFNCANKHRLLKEIIQDNNCICYLPAVGPSPRTYHGNACPDA